MLKAATSLGIIFFPAFDWAISPTHPEREERLLYTQDQFREEGLFDIEGISEYRPLYASNEDIMRAHFCFPSVEAVCTESHHVSAGGAIRAAQLVMEGETQRAFALVRPPGHHAMKVVHGNRGFCNINIEAVMVEWIRKHYGRKRIAIVDTDCHHGDGTQDIYWHDPDVLFISIHQDGRTLYPGSGFPDENGGPRALGKTINIPLPPRTADTGYLHVLEQVVLPILEDFKPDLVINSAGQDNHYSDPITNMQFSAQGYARLNELLKPDIAVLEGGYSIKGALPYVNLGICLAMAGCDYSAVREPDFNRAALREQPEVLERIKQLCPVLLDGYFHPEPGDFKREKGFFIRQRRIYYDTEGILEQQREALKDCDQCRGLRLIRTSSSHIQTCLGVELPIDCCPDCEREGYAAFENKRENYVVVQMLDQKNNQFCYRSGN
ncbi:MAG: histone deacetylase [Desulfobulbus sp.]|jgi:acetoin utilization deacetylase AcuC-like enzyme